ncbi:hypothetical protein QBC32DRAFT_222770 [Pseudoneurospora amorphoporcata]|uniref:Cell surface protein n=1 Tax=Pseudoneurospora amorphoporcata TaxID=241081 RepID=A0AAN6NNH5_9PEZI|nr:hypothetical protein QBC32DRAFT_222770 [Pseudoneurospora amorphoporcata]
MSGIINKIKEAVHSDNSAHHGAPEGTAGPHNSRVANAADPRVDSDMDGSHRKVAGHGEYGSGHAYGSGHPETYTHGANTTYGGSNNTGTYAGTHTGTHTGTHNTHGTSEGAYGPHSSRAANALDPHPRVDSDRDGSRTAGNTGYNTHSTGNTFGTTGTGTYAGTHNAHGTSEGAYGPHSSRAANALDPRVDSDRDGSRTAGNTTGTHNTGTHNTGNTFGTIGTHDRQNHPFSSNTHSNVAGSGHTGVTGTHGAPTGTYGPHDSRAANTLDPRVDSDRDGRAANLGHHAGPGPAPNTAGPHKSDMANKLDPRVDSDLDGSKTVGGNKTYQQ